MLVRDDVPSRGGISMSESLVEAAAAAARAGGEIGLASWRNLAAGEVSEKRKNDFVTDADRESEERIVARIRESFSGDSFLGEEGGRRGTAGGGRTWIIDPLDGTSNFIAGFPFWSVSIAAREGDEIVGVLRGDPERGGAAWVGALGVRRQWRKRGLGLALLRHAFAEFYRRGQPRIGLGVDAQNPTGATRLYERAGMHIAYEAVAFSKELG